MPVEEQNASVNSNESLLDYSNAKDESESLLKDQPKENNLKMSFSPWSKLLNMYSKMKKSPIPKFHSKENSQELLKEDGQRIQLIVYRCNESNPLVFSHFRTTDSVGFVEMEIKKMLDVQNEVRLWKKGLNDETSLLQRSDSTLKDAGILREQVLLLEEKDVHESRSWH
ncbi:gametogenetin-binding protein 1-like isoform X3 [Rhincodon typus]|uniref:gametogenetin-binding protein 1-like isoform X3 n=1 Tax=Rhincodon typus TaxID=259920 RepID=UPI00202EA3F9|nr:gametogenetin-binding protein 1-like isoform X3 [Rhincodon typus]XP_048467997.1 gametogenetin-binding protein 1-like isoform X3 [Rhincodon typus]XP_048467998.1 gametogenetin-binding protein 1-like isoform X3 [Rhincodon typus]